MLVESAPRQCTYDYPFKTVLEYLDFNVKLTRWVESGNWCFLSHLDSKEVATFIVQAEAIEARQQAVFWQLLGLHPMPIWLPKIPKTLKMSTPAPEFNDPNRLQVITELIQALKIKEEISVPTWLSLWFADLSTLRTSIEKTKDPVHKNINSVGFSGQMKR